VRILEKYLREGSGVAVLKRWGLPQGGKGDGIVSALKCVKSPLKAKIISRE